MNIYRELRNLEDKDKDKDLKRRIQELEDKLKKCLSSDSSNSSSPRDFIDKNNLYYYAFFGGLWQQPQEYMISKTKYCGIETSPNSQDNFDKNDKNKFEDNKQDNDKNKIENVKNIKQNNDKNNNNKLFPNNPLKHGDNNNSDKNVITLRYIIPSSKDIDLKKDTKVIDSKTLTIPFVVFDKACLRVNRKKNISIEYIRMLSDNKVLASSTQDSNIICENTTGSNNFNCKDCVNCTDCWDCVNCENCTNCIGLVNCKNCINSESCQDCIDCASCFKCKILKKCVNCFNCEELVNSITCYQCKFLGELVNCTRLDNCEYCTNCIDCSNTRRSNNCVNVNNSYDCDRSFDLNNCSNCIGCLGCSDSSKLKNCTDTSMSTNSNNCVSCVSCKFSNDLFKCTEMNHCKYCKYSNKCYNSSWILYSNGITSSNTCYRCSNLEDSNVNYYCKNSTEMYFCIDSDTCVKCKNTIRSNQISNSSNVFVSFDINDSTQCYDSKNITHSSYCVSSENIEYSNYVYNSMNLTGDDDISCGYRRTYSDTFIEKICNQNDLSMKDIIVSSPKQKNDVEINQILDNQFKRKKSDYEQVNEPKQNNQGFKNSARFKSIHENQDNFNNNDTDFRHTNKAQRQLKNVSKKINLSKTDFEAKPKFEFESKHKFEPESKHKFEHESKLKFEHESKHKFEHESKHKFEPESKSEFKHDFESKSKYESKPKFEFESKHKFEPKSKSESKHDFESKSKHDFEPKFEPETEPKSNSESKSKFHRFDNNGEESVSKSKSKNNFRTLRKSKSLRVYKHDNESNDESDNKNSNNSNSEKSRDIVNKNIFNQCEDVSLNDEIQVFKIIDGFSELVTVDIKSLIMQDMSDCENYEDLFNSVYMSLQIDSVYRGCDFTPDFVNLLEGPDKLKEFIESLKQRSCLMMAYFIENKSKIEDIDTLNELVENFQVLVNQYIFSKNSVFLENYDEFELSQAMDDFGAICEENFSTEEDVMKNCDLIAEPYIGVDID